MYYYIFSFIGISLKSTCLEINNTVACPMYTHFARPELAFSMHGTTINNGNSNSSSSNNKRMTLIYLSFLTIALFVRFIPQRVWCRVHVCTAPTVESCVLPFIEIHWVFIVYNVAFAASICCMFAFVFNENSNAQRTLQNPKLNSFLMRPISRSSTSFIVRIRRRGKLHSTEK